MTPDQTFGPNNKAVVTFIEGCRTLSPTDLVRLNAIWSATWTVSWATTGDAAHEAERAIRYAARSVEWRAAQKAVRDTAQGIQWDAPWAAVLAILASDLITPEQYNLLTQTFVDDSFASMVGR